MEIERKFLVDLSDLPFDPKDYPARKIDITGRTGSEENSLK